ncbi:hypothetical protein Rsub_12174 [Raphidocelis subcapitata]|uniref:Uncharacterized protein n=1 Tax=Raphidocelis subcapitata TaxID=307507 RepID=A0A2V0PN77_9CHLO|nr:hypothetical protein Rsub_12174 [Raphidocelis subcapitata]|eukprot:GBF99370.1 hypothetical protein Rsub_12174 [Raphidocelis subcapitata]
MAQSHASRHAVSEHLADRHAPQGAAPPPGRAEAEAVTEAYGRRRIPRLVGVLTSPTASSGDRTAALHTLNTLLATQEAKAEAIAAGAPAALVACLLGLPSGGGRPEDGAAPSAAATEAAAAQQWLCCTALGALAQLRQGRAALSGAVGLEALMSALATVPEPAAAALRAFSASTDGVAALRACPASACAALVDALGRVGTGLAAARDAAAVLGAVAAAGGVLEACGAQVPAAVAGLARRVVRFPLDGANGGLLRAVLAEACTCLRALSRDPEGKAQVRVAGGIEVLAAVLKAPGADAELRRVAAAALAGLAVDAAAKLPVVVNAGAPLVALLRAAGEDAEAAGAAAAALRLSAESLDARRKLEVLMPPGQAEALLGRLPEAPPSYRYVATVPRG